MSESPVHDPAPPPATGPVRRSESNRFRLAAAVILIGIVAIVGWLVLRDDGNSSSSATSKSSAKSVTAAGLASFARSAGQPVYWLGPQPGATYELKKDKTGVYVRYLPSAADVGSERQFRTVATYPFRGAYAALVKVASDSGETPSQIPGGGIALPAKGHPQSVHVAYPGVDYQMEVFDPTVGAAEKAVTAGDLVAVGKPAASPPAVTAATLATLRELPTTLGHPVYWVGARSGMTYELTRNGNGSVIIRYLPKGTKVGVDKPFLTVATYPFPGALQSLKTVAKNKALKTVDLPGGGIAVIDPAVPHNAHLAFPGEAYQVEVFDPFAAKVAQLVRSGRVAPLG